MKISTLAFEEKWLRAADGTTLFLRCVAPQKDSVVRGSILLLHGMGEHSARYFHVASHLVARGYSICAMDLRGHGRSAGRRGDIENYEVLIEDVQFVWQQFCAANAQPLFLYGHSLGGQVAINFILKKKPVLRGAIIASPWLDLAFKPAWWKLFLAQAAMKIWPMFTQRTDVNPNRLSRDLAFLQSMSDLDLVHHFMSARMFFELTRGAAHARSHAQGFHSPALFIHGAADPVTSVSATREFFEKATCPDKTLHVYPDTLHETHNDLSRAQVLDDILNWLDAHSASARPSDRSNRPLAR